MIIFRPVCCICRRALLRISATLMLGVSSMKNGASLKRPAASASFDHSWRWMKPLRSEEMSMRASLPTMGHGSGPNGTCVIQEDIITHHCGGSAVKVIEGFWEWRLSMNPGSAFGLFGSLGPSVTRVLLSVVGVAAVVGMWFMLKKARSDQKVLHWALALVAGGAVGNLIDRIYFSVVTDFILWKYKTHEWPVFNIADVVLVIGVGLMFIDIQKENKREKLARKDRQAKAKKAGLVKDVRE